MLLGPVAALLICSCRDNQKITVASVKSGPTFFPPVTVLLDTVPSPKKAYLKNTPPPQVVPLKPPVITISKPSIADFTNFNTEQGLISGRINCGMMDKKGQLWFSMGNYVARYDGSDFLSFRIGQGSLILSIAEDNDGNIWFASWGGGVYRYDGVRFTNFTTRDGLANDMVNKVFRDKKGNLWFSTYGGGVSCFDGIKFKTFNMENGLADNEVNFIEEDNNGNLWFGTLEGGISRFDGTRFSSYTTNDGLAHNAVFSILCDKNGVIWFGTLDGVSRYNPAATDPVFENFKLDERIVSKNINVIAQDRKGNLWFGTYGGGVCSYDGSRFTVLTSESGLANDRITSITEDRNSNMWFGSYGAGLSRYNGKSFNALSEHQGLPQNQILSIEEDRSGNLWFGTYGTGMCRYNGKIFTRFTMNQGLPDDQVNCIFQDRKGNYWLSTPVGASLFDGKRFITFTTKHGMVYPAVNKFIEDKSGRIWMSTQEGVSCFDGKSFTSYTTSQGLGYNNVTGMAEGPDVDIWFGTEGGGVSRFNGKSFTNYSVEQGLAHNIVRSILKDGKGNLWFGTLGGVSRYDGSGFISFNSTHGLSDNIVADIVEDFDGVLWFGTDKGFSSLKFKNSNEIKGAGLFYENNDQLKHFEVVFETYNDKTGYPAKELIERAMCIKKVGFPFRDSLDKGTIWGGSADDRAIQFEPRTVAKSDAKSSPYLRSIKINETPLNWYSLGTINRDTALTTQQEIMVYGKPLQQIVRDSLREKFGDIKFDSITPFFQMPTHLVLPYTHNRITIDFAAIETGRNFMVRYQHILEGYDNEWSPVTDQTSVTYGNIDEGNYTFKLKARSPGGVWSEPVVYSFKVLPPWWRTWWFRALMGLGLLFLLYGMYRWRTAALHRQKRKLEQTVKDRTAEVVKEKSEVEKRNILIQKEKEKSDELLLNILPSEVAEELKAKGHTTAKAYDEVTVMFSDIKGFTNVAEKMSAEDLVKEIDTYFSSFDRIMMEYGLEKIKTIGDAYVAAGGIPENNPATAQDVVEAAISMQKTVEKFKQERTAAGKPYFELRIGIHTGPVVAGVVGIKKFQYDIWGDTVNLAARMEQSGVAGKINISQHTYELVKEHFTCIHRGKIDAKNKGEIDMYFVG